MKNIKSLIIVLVLFLTSCTNNQPTKDQDQTSPAVKEIINSYNYDKVSNYDFDTISLVKVDSIINVKNYPNVGYATDTSNIKIIDHIDINLIVVTVKQHINGYYKNSTMLIGHVKSKKPFLINFTSETSLINKSISEFKLNDSESIKLAKQKIIDYEKYTNK